MIPNGLRKTSWKFERIISVWALTHSFHRSGVLNASMLAFAEVVEKDDVKAEFSLKLVKFNTTFLLFISRMKTRLMIIISKKAFINWNSEIWARMFTKPMWLSMYLENQNCRFVIHVFLSSINEICQLTIKF